MENLIMTELVIRYISGLASEEEKKEVLDWIELSDENKKLYSELKNYWVFEKMRSFDNTNEKAVPNKKVYWIKTVYRIAAILILAFSVFGAYYLYTTNNKDHQMQAMATFEYVVNTGVKGIVNLPDGSKVWLNSSSSIKCPEKFGTDKREIELEGEGYFKIAHDKNWPMYVKTSKGITIKVTGTEFNLSSYSNDDKLIVTLVSGKISLLNDKDEKEINVNPSEEVVITGSNISKLNKNANVEYNTAWKNGLLLFDNTPMDEVIKKMERWYGVSVNVEDPSILEYRFTANFKSESISQVLDILKLSSNIQYQIDQTKITLKKI